MGMMGVFKWLRKDIGYRDRNGRSLTSLKQNCLNDSYRSALQAFIDRRRFSDSTTLMTVKQDSPGTKSLFAKRDNNSNNDNGNGEKEDETIREVPYVSASEIFEIGCVAGTEDRYLELIFAEWENTRVALKRNTHPNCKRAVKADVEILVKIRHPNVLLLMAITQTEDHGLVSIFESVECTIFNYMHEQGEKISVHEIAKYAGKLADALRHAHTRGYVHSAISSHCVYLVSGNTVKLGGWELATHKNNPKPEREYEERLRNEVFRWQAPELFHDYKAYKESDVYGLALLIWEMFTMQIPWNGYSISQLKQKYTESKNNVAIELHNLPPFISSLLEAGLQVDVTKRSLDINRMQRLLQNLEIKYECRDPIYAGHFVNRNNESTETFVLPIVESLNRTWHYHEHREGLHFAKNRTSVPSICSELVISAQHPSIINTSQIGQENLLDDHKENETPYVNKPRRYTNIPTKIPKKSDTTQPLNQKSHHSDVLSNVNNNLKPLQPWNYVYKRVEVPKKVTDCKNNDVSMSPRSPNTTDDNHSVSENARVNIKRLKEQLSSERERFFYGNDTNTGPNIQNEALVELKTKDYEPHKPASHKTSLEPKYNKSPDQFNSTYALSSQRRKSPYAHTPADIKSAIIQPRILNPDPQSFFESSLWKKEKQICISKMRKDDQNEETVTMERVEDAAAKLKITKCDKTYIIGNIENPITIESTNVSTESTLSESDSEQREVSSQNNSLRILKDTLDRATEIVRSTSSNSTVIIASSPSSDNFEMITDSFENFKATFENIYDVKSRNESDEIKSIEETNNENYVRSLEEKKSIINNPPSTTTNDVNKAEKDEPRIFSNSPISENSFLSNVRQSTKCFFNTIAELSFPTTIATDIPEKTEKVGINDLATTRYSCLQPFHCTESVSKSLTNKHEKEIFESLLPKDKDCNTCSHKINLARRRSLPAALCHLRSGSNSTLGKLPIRKAENIMNNSVEDFYIDDDDLEMMNLNTDMLLLEGDILFDQFTLDK